MCLLSCFVLFCCVLFVLALEKYLAWLRGKASRTNMSGGVCYSLLHLAQGVDYLNCSFP